MRVLITGKRIACAIKAMPFIMEGYDDAEEQEGERALFAVNIVNDILFSLNMPIPVAVFEELQNCAAIMSAQYNDSTIARAILHRAHLLHAIAHRQEEEEVHPELQTWYNNTRGQRRRVVAKPFSLLPECSKAVRQCVDCVLTCAVAVSTAALLCYPLQARFITIDKRAAAWILDKPLADVTSCFDIFVKPPPLAAQPQPCTNRTPTAPRNHGFFWRQLRSDRQHQSSFKTDGVQIHLQVRARQDELPGEASRFNVSGPRVLGSAVVP